MTDYLRGEQFLPPALEEQLRRLMAEWYHSAKHQPVPGLQGPLANGGWLPLPTASATFRGKLAADLSTAPPSPDTYAQVHVLRPDDTNHPGGPFYALNTYLESGATDDLCLLLPNDQASTEGQYPYILLRVVPKLLTTYQPGYDGAGGFTAIAQSFYGAGSAPAGSATVYVTAVAPGSDLQRDTTTIAVSVSTSSITYGTLVDLTATVSHSAGTGDPTGIVAFYDGSNPAPIATASVGSGGVATASNVLVKAGTWHINAAYGGDASYDASYTTSSASLAVAQATPTVTLSVSGIGTYGDLVTLTATVSASAGTPTGFVIFNYELGSGPVLQAGLPTRIAAGSVTVTTTKLPAGPSLGIVAHYDGDDNFTSLDSSPCNTAIAKAVLTVTAHNAVKIYGDANPAFSASLAGFQNSETPASATTGSPSVTSAATAATGVGTAAITAAAGTLAADNYTFSYVAATLTINPAPLVATADDQSMTSGDPLPALTGTLSGIKNSDALTFAGSTAASSSSPPGSYVITAGISGSTSNYTVTLHDGTLTVT